MAARNHWIERNPAADFDLVVMLRPADQWRDDRVPAATNQATRAKSRPR